MSSKHQTYDLGNKMRIALPSLEAIHQWLKTDITWPSNTLILNVCYRRLWALRRGGICFELNIEIAEGENRRMVTLQGGTGLPSKRGTHRCIAKLSTHGLMGLRLYSDKFKVWVCSPDRDKRIQWLPKLLSRTAVGQLLEPYQPHAQQYGTKVAKPDRPHLDIMAYRAQRRCVVHAHYQSSSQCTDFYIKGFRRLPPSCDAGFLRRLGDELNNISGGKVGTAIPILIDPTRCIVITAQISTNAKHLQSSVSDVGLAAQALAKLHTCKVVNTLAIHSSLNEMNTLTHWLAVLPNICGAGDIDRLHQSITALAALDQNQSEKSNVIIHRDYYFSQLQNDIERTWIVDLDTLCLGERELDVATFLAHLVLDGASRSSADPTPGVLAAEFVDVYCENGGVIDNRRLAFYLPCAMLRLGAIHQARSIPKAVSLLWDTADSLLGINSTNSSVMEILDYATRKTAC